MERRMILSSEKTGEVSVVFTGENSRTAEAVWAALPVKGSANRWGDEVYFSVPVDVEEENGRVEVEMGSVAFWPLGHALCVFFGPTPVSLHGEPRAYSPVNVFANVVGDAGVFRKVRDNDRVTLNRFKQ